MRTIPTTAEQKKIDTALRRLKKSRFRHETEDPQCFVISDNPKTREEKTLAQHASYLHAMGVLCIVRHRVLGIREKKFAYTLYRIRDENEEKKKKAILRSVGLMSQGLTG